MSKGIVLATGGCRRDKERMCTSGRLTRRLFLYGMGAALLGGRAQPVVLAAPGTVAPNSMSFATVVQRRAMVRAYKPDPVPERTIRRLLRYAVRAPSAGNLQPWEFILVRSAENRDRLAKAALGQTWMATAPLIIATCANIQRSGQRYGARGTFYSLIDTAFASLLILLGAVEQGLGACFVGAYNPEEVAKILALPEHVRPVGLITIGYPAESPRRPGTPKIPLHQLIHEEKW
ncbi:MAG: nitroreductase family protein [Candidatus Binatia bacterium]|nr:nitroreductase family protein [Candidatus Binatia bacterium]